jgi:hypothetical protein
MTNNLQLFRIIYYSLAALHVSSDIFAHHQEYLNYLQLLLLHIVIRSFNYNTNNNHFYSSILLLTIVQYNTSKYSLLITVCKNRSCKYSLDASDYERKYRSKHVKQPRNLVGYFRKLYHVAQNHEYKHK